VSSALKTKVCEILGCQYPIVQTGMGWVATPELVAGACNAGAFGFFAAATIRSEEIDAAIAKIQKLTDKPFGVNFLMEQPGAEHIVDAIIGSGIKAASYGRAPNAKFIEKFKKAGVLCVPTIGAARHAIKAVKLGADILIAQGGEGGGHTGTVPTSILVPQTVDSVKVPVMAAGGFRDGRGLVAALAYGAQGIAMGTRFLLTAESPLPAETAKRYLAASVNDIFVTREVDGMPQRVIQNEFVNRLESSNALVALLRALMSGLAYRKFSGASIQELLKSALAMKRGDDMTRRQTLMAPNSLVFIKRAMVEGKPAQGVLPSGTVAGLIDDRPTCKELIDRIIREAEETLARLAN
jgi:NAD(P)H-dependent flavin oxidoreductase YrpB (nitropropane dioxygenase family)